MKAVVNLRYGSPDVLSICEMPKPEPQAGEVLIKIHATTVNRTDCGSLRAHPFFMRLATGLIRPKLKILGMDFAGEVKAIGAGTTRFKLGDRVFGMSPDKFGAHAEYLCLPEAGEIELMPNALGYNEVVVCEGAWYAHSNLETSDLVAGQEILIYGASGAIGTAAVQLAKARGAGVTAVVSTRHLELAASLGADRVIDYTAEDFTQIGKTFDLVFDAVGKTSYFKCRRLLKLGGAYRATDFGPWGQNLFLMLWSALARRGRVEISMPRDSKAVVTMLKTLLNAGTYRAVIDRKYPLQKIADAYRYVETEQKAGIVVIEVVPGND